MKSKKWMCKISRLQFWNAAIHSFMIVRQKNLWIISVIQYWAKYYWYLNWLNRLQDCSLKCSHQDLLLLLILDQSIALSKPASTDKTFENSGPRCFHQIFETIFLRYFINIFERIFLQIFYLSLWAEGGMWVWDNSLSLTCCNLTELKVLRK